MHFLQIVLETQKMILRQSEAELLETQKGIAVCEGKRTKIDENLVSF